MLLFHRKVGEGRPIIILHGVFGSSDNWFTVSKMIADKGFAVYTLDARNHGQSPKSDEFSYDLMAEDLDEFLNHYQIKNPIIIGHSMGGKVIMQYAMKYDNFEKLIVVDIAPKYYPTHHEHIINGLQAIDLETLKSRNEAEAIFAQYVSNIGERQFILKNIYRTENGKFDWRINVPVIAREIYQIGSELHDVHPINKPVLFIKGSQSGYIQDEDMSDIKKIFPQVQLISIEGAGHWVQAEKPQEFVAAVVDFCG